MRSVSELTRVPVGRWVKIRLRTGNVIVGKILAHHDNKPNRHTVETVDGDTICVDFPVDRLEKMSTNKPPRILPSDTAPKPIPVETFQEPLAQAETDAPLLYDPPPAKSRSTGILWGLVGYALGFVSAVVVALNLLRF